MTSLRRFIVEVSVETETFPDNPNTAADEFHDAIGQAPFPAWVSSIDFVEPGREDPA